MASKGAITVVSGDLDKLHAPHFGAPSRAVSPKIKAGHDGHDSSSASDPSPKQAQISELLSAISVALDRKEPNAEDAALLTLFNHRLVVMEFSEEEKREAHLAAATRHLAEVVAFPMKFGSSRKALDSPGKVGLPVLPVLVKFSP